MRTTRKLALLAAGLIGGALLNVVPAAPASATVYCNIEMVYQNAFVPGNDGTFTPNCLLGQGAVNNGVASLQDALKTCYRKNISIDSNFGPQTKAALVAVQSSLHITADGVYGPQSARAMSHPIVSGGGACKRITF